MEYMLRHIDTYDYRRISINTYSVVHYIPFIQYTQMRANICTYQVSVQYIPISIHATQTKNNTYQYIPVRCCRGASATPSCDSALGGATPRRDSARDHSVQAVTPCPCPWLSGHATADTQQQQQWNCKSLANRISGLSVTRKLSVNSEFGILFGWIGITPISDTVTHIYRTVTVVHVLMLATRLAAAARERAYRSRSRSIPTCPVPSLMSRALWLAWLSAALRCRASQASWIASDWSQSLWGILEEADLTRVCQVEPSSASDPWFAWPQVAAAVTLKVRIYETVPITVRSLTDSYPPSYGQRWGFSRTSTLPPSANQTLHIYASKSILHNVVQHCTVQYNVASIIFYYIFIHFLTFANIATCKLIVRDAQDRTKFATTIIKLEIEPNVEQRCAISRYN